MTVRRMSIDVSEREPPRPPAFGGWNLDTIVADLRNLRNASLAARRPGAKPVKLPSRRLLSGIVDGLSAALFPNRLGARELTHESVDYFVGRTLDTALHDLTSQVVRELDLAGDSAAEHLVRRDQALQIVTQFAALLPAIRTLLESDVAAVFEGEPAARTLDEVLACYPGITAIAHHRFAHALWELGAPLVARIIAAIAHSQTGIDIHPGAVIGESFFIDHGTGVVIGETAVIGARVRVYHGVTLGARSPHRAAEVRSGGELQPRHPVVEDDVVIYAGATLLGRIRVGRGSIIGGNVWLTRDVAAKSIVSQAALNREEFDGGSGI